MDCGLGLTCFAIPGTSDLSCAVTQVVGMPSTDFTFHRGDPDRTFIQYSSFVTADSRCGSEGYECSLTHTSGVDTSRCMRIGTSLTGKIDMMTSTCAVIGSGLYDLICGTNATGFGSITIGIKVTIHDYCHNRLASASPATIQYIRLQNGASTQPLGNFITVSNANCVLNPCSIVSSTASTCSTTAVSHFTGSISGTTVSLNINTSIYRAPAYYCLRCSTNENPTTYTTSNPFQMSVEQCSMTLSNIADQMYLLNAGSSLTISTRLGYISDPNMNIFAITYQLQDAATSNLIVSTQLWLDSSFNVKANANLGAAIFNAKVKITCGNEVFSTNNFKVQFYCPPITQGLYPLPFAGTQYVDLGPAARFMLPPFTTGAGSCPILSQDLTENSSTVSVVSSPFLNAPIETAAGSGQYVIYPQNANTHKSYTFWVFVSAPDSKTLMST